MKFGKNNENEKKLNLIIKETNQKCADNTAVLQHNTANVVI
jgi:hypothetical protein